MSTNYEKLQVYQKALFFVDQIYLLTKKFPKEEIFLLVNQLRWASVSIVLNIAEGSGRTKKEFKHFLNMSRTSCYECEAALEIAKRQNYISIIEQNSIAKMCDELLRMLNGLKNSL